MTTFYAHNRKFQSFISFDFNWISTRRKRHRNPVVKIFHIELLVASTPFIATAHGCQNLVTAVSDVSCNIVQLRYKVFFLGGGRPLSRSHDLLLLFFFKLNMCRYIICMERLIDVCFRFSSVYCNFRLCSLLFWCITLIVRDVSLSFLLCTFQLVGSLMWYSWFVREQFDA